MHEVLISGPGINPASAPDICNINKITIRIHR